MPSCPIRTIITAVLVALVAACAQVEPPCSECSPAENRYLSVLLAGADEQANALSEEELLWWVSLGNLYCDLLRQGEDPDYVRESFVDLYGITPGTAVALSGAAVKELCTGGT